MVASAQSGPAATTSNGSFKSFADMVDYTKLCDELGQHGINLTEQEKKRLEVICGDRLRNHDGGQVIGNSFGGTIQGLVYTLFAIVKNIFSGNFSGSLGDIASNIGSTISTSSEQSKLFQLQLAASESYLRLQAAGGNLAKAAEYITGVKPNADNSPPKELNASIFNQVGQFIKLPLDTDTSLNSKPADVADHTGPGNLPPRPSRQALTAHR